MLSLGRVDELVVDLEPFVRADPLHGAVRGAADDGVVRLRTSVRCPTRLRTRSSLRVELGVDPSRELRATMEQTLRQQGPVLRSTSDEGVQRQDRARAELPLRATSFPGREELMSGVIRRLDGSPWATSRWAFWRSSASRSMDASKASKVVGSVRLRATSK
jgi:hypothetical protein